MRNVLSSLRKLTKTMDVSRLVRCAKRNGMKFNMLLCWCVGRAASRIDEFFLLPEGGKLMRYDQLAINVIVPNRQGGINSCDILFTEDLRQFNSTMCRWMVPMPPAFWRRCSGR